MEAASFQLMEGEIVHENTQVLNKVSDLYGIARASSVWQQVKIVAVYGWYAARRGGRELGYWGNEFSVYWGFIRRDGIRIVHQRPQAFS